MTDTQEEQREEPEAPAVEQKPVRKTKSRPVRVITHTGVAGSALTAVIAIMCYLGSLALGAVILINKSVSDWTSDVSSQITIQIKPEAGRDIEQDIQKTLAILRVTRGINGAQVITMSKSAELLEPWLGEAAFLKDLPVPRLIAVKLNQTDPPNMVTLSKTVQSNVPNATLDTHRRWQGQIIRSANTLQIIGYAVLVLISLTTAAIIVFATRAAMVNNRSTLEVLHLIGARDTYIARLIQLHFLKLGLRAGLIAGVAGALSFFLLGNFGGNVIQGNLTASNIDLISLPNFFQPAEYLIFLLIPIAAILITMITARLAILRILSHVL